jgi:endonuclease-3 related protein
VGARVSAARTSPGGRLQPGATGRDGRAPSPARRLPTRAQLGTVYRALLATHGEQQWWPTASEDAEVQRLEICLGAILTQNTSWRGAAAALERLHAADRVSCEALLDCPLDVLGDLVRPSGHYRVKARKLQEFARTVVEEYGGSVDALLDGGPDGEAGGGADAVRARLLAIWGIGPETADAITLYAARLPTFVVDAYSYRLFERLDLAPGERRYDVYRRFLLDRIGPDVWRLNEWHALIVRHGQQVCLRSAPRCEECALLGRCPFGRAEVGLAARGAAKGTS